MTEYYKILDLADIVYFCEEDNVWKTEEWKKIPKYEDKYSLSCLGRIKSLSRTINNNGGTFLSKEKILKQCFSSNGYLAFQLTKDSVQEFFLTHQLCAVVFHDHKMGGYDKVVDHKNNIKCDNRKINLQLITNRENSTKYKNNTSSKLPGVCWDKYYKKWVSRIKFKKSNSTSCFLIRTDNEDLAGLSYQIAVTLIDSYNGSNSDFRKLVQDALLEMA